MAQSTIVGQDSSVKATGTEEPSKKRAPSRRKKGVSFERRFTAAAETGFEHTTFELRKSVITNPDGSVVFKMDGAEIPAAWSQLATDLRRRAAFREDAARVARDQAAR